MNQQQNRIHIVGLKNSQLVTKIKNIKIKIKFRVFQEVSFANIDHHHSSFESVCFFILVNR
jgi:hypothetical protein